MATNLIREATREDLHFIAANLRKSDIEELRAAHGDRVDFDVAIYMASLRSDPCQVWCTPDGEPMAVFGFAKLLHRPGMLVPWLLGTDKLKLHAKNYVAEAKRVLAENLTSQTPYMFNYVHAKNKSSVRFLRALGFTMHEPEPFGRKNELFHMFDIGSYSVCVNATSYGTLMTDSQQEASNVH